MARVGFVVREELKRWYNSLLEPERHQNLVLRNYLKYFACTDMGRSLGLLEIDSYEEYSRRVPVRSYEEYARYINLMIEGRCTITPEDPVIFGLSSGTTGKPKLIPLTKSDVETRRKLMLIGMVHCEEVWRKRLHGRDSLMFCLPSRVASLEVKGRKIACGYISGILAEILTGGTPEWSSKLRGDKQYWRKYFEEALDAFLQRDVSLILGPAPMIYEFGLYVKKRLKRRPADVRRVEVVMCFGVPDIQESYVDELRRLYGEGLSVVEGYGATEGMLALQYDERGVLAPFYNAYFYEVRVGGKVKPLYSMRQGEVGELIVTTPSLLRYRMGDLVECCSDGRLFRVLGRHGLASSLSFKLQKIFSHLLSLF
ncbi:MAG: hypothetical protein DRJ62_00705 [Thermoprotei archaeon]|nr:MAG: hypothetical protein DRJ62_00705 [Thermoprotei archaeon]